MGYMGLDHWGESDEAAEVYSAVTDAIAGVLRGELPKKANCYNTAGYINVALIIEDMFIKGYEIVSLYADSELMTVIKDTYATLQNNLIHIERTDPTDYSDYEEHVNAHARLIHNLRKIIDASY